MRWNYGSSAKILRHISLRYYRIIFFYATLIYLIISLKLNKLKDFIVTYNNKKTKNKKNNVLYNIEY